MYGAPEKARSYSYYGEGSSQRRNPNDMMNEEVLWNENNKGYCHLHGDLENHEYRYASPSNQQNEEEDNEASVMYRGDIENWFDQLQDKVLIGLCHGPMPSMEALKGWVSTNWENKNIFPNHIQYLPNNYYLFFFDDSNSALQVISNGQWLIKSTPLSFFRWYRGFDPRGEKRVCIPIWVDFPDLPVDFYPWLKNIGAKIGKVMGQKSRGGIKPEWDPQLLIEVNVSKALEN
ncbi:hypothetical protein L7F22_058644 [Adiantum nelumboides]|nr:hypothetical protein [Adiantum nelumboides]